VADILVPSVHRLGWHAPEQADLKLLVEGGEALGTTELPLASLR